MKLTEINLLQALEEYDMEPVQVIYLALVVQRILQVAEKSNSEEVTFLTTDLYDWDTEQTSFPQIPHKLGMLLPTLDVFGYIKYEGIPKKKTRRYSTTKSRLADLEKIVLEAIKRHDLFSEV